MTEFSRVGVRKHYTPRLKDYADYPKGAPVVSYCETIVTNRYTREEMDTFPTCLTCQEIIIGIQEQKMSEEISFFWELRNELNEWLERNNG